jgi:hypothetical protein
MHKVYSMFVIVRISRQTIRKKSPQNLSGQKTCATRGVLIIRTGAGGRGGGGYFARAYGTAHRGTYQGWRISRGGGGRGGLGLKRIYIFVFRREYI